MIHLSTYSDSNISLSAIYLYQSIRHFVLSITDLCQWVNTNIIHRYPLTCIIIVILSSYIISMVSIGQARAERDTISKKLYITEQQLQKITK